MSTLKVDTLQTTGGAGLYPARAWVNFNGLGTVAILGGGNASSITDNTTGDYTVNFTNSLSTVNYSAVCTSGRPDANSVTARLSANTTYATSSFRFRTGTVSGFTDALFNNLQFTLS